MWDSVRDAPLNRNNWAHQVHQSQWDQRFQQEKKVKNDISSKIHVDSPALERVQGGKKWVLSWFRGWNRSACAKSKWKRVPDSRGDKRKGSLLKVRFHVRNNMKMLVRWKQVIKSNINWWSVNKVRTKWILRKEEGRGKWCILKEWNGAPERKEERTFLIRHELKVPDILLT